MVFLQSHLMWLRLSSSSIDEVSFRVLGRSRLEASSVDPLKCQTTTATPAEPGGLSLTLVREVAQHIQRIQKTRENANIKLTSVISNIVGTSRRRILKALIAGETNAAKLAELGSTRLKCLRTELTAALDGRVTAHRRFLIAHHRSLIEELERHIAAFDARIDKLLAPLRNAVEQLITIPGVSRVSAKVILAEIGADMTPFPTSGHLLSWAGLMPRLDENAGKRRSTRIRKEAPWLKPVLVQCAWGAARTKGHLLSGTVLPLQSSTRPQKGCHCSGGIVADRRLPHAEERHVPPRHRRRFSCQTRQGPHRYQAR